MQQKVKQVRKNNKNMLNSVMGVEAVAAESAKKGVCINRKASEVMSLQKALGNFCKILNNHDDSDNIVYIDYTARITPDFKVNFHFVRPNSERYNYITYMRIGLNQREGNGKWYCNNVLHVDVKDSRDVWALVEELKGKIKAEYGEYATKGYEIPTKLMDAILAA